MKNPKNEYYSWQQFAKDVEIIIEKIKDNGLIFKNIYGHPRGGLALAVCLSHRLNHIPVILNPGEIDKSTLIVDDIADTGKTFIDYYRRGNFIVTLFYHQQSAFVPHIWLREKKKKYIVFPWESE